MSEIKQLVILESENWKVTLSENQYYLGRSFIVFKGNASHLSDLNEKEFKELLDIIRNIEFSIKKSFNAVHFNWTCLMNDYYKPQNRDKKIELHCHLWPRYSQEVEFEGEKFNDEVFGHHYDKTKQKLVNQDLLEKICDKIKSNLLNT